MTLAKEYLCNLGRNWFILQCLFTLVLSNLRKNHRVIDLYYWRFLLIVICYCIKRLIWTTCNTILIFIKFLLLIFFQLLLFLLFLISLHLFDPAFFISFAHMFVTFDKTFKSFIIECLNPWFIVLQNIWMV